MRGVVGSEGLDHVGPAELGVGGVLVNRPVLADALLAGGLIEPSDGGVHGTDQGESDGGAGGVREEVSAHRRKQRQCTADEGHKQSP